MQCPQCHDSGYIDAGQWGRTHCACGCTPDLVADLRHGLSQLLTPDEIDPLIAHAQEIAARGRYDLATIAQRLRQCYRRLAQHGVPRQPATALSAVLRQLEQTSGTAKWQALLLELMRMPSMITARARVVRHRAELLDEHGRRLSVEISRGGTRGMSPQLGALLEHVIDQAARHGTRDERGDYIVHIPDHAIHPFMGRTTALTGTHLRRVAESLGAVYRLTVFGRRDPRFLSEGILLVSGVSRSHEGHITFRVAGPVAEVVRQRDRNEVRFVPAAALPVLAGLSSIAAGLVRWLAPRWHGRQHIDVPLWVERDGLHVDLVGTHLPPDSHAAHRKFGQRLHRAVTTINDGDIFRLLDVQEPRRIVCLTDPTRVGFQRQ